MALTDKKKIIRVFPRRTKATPDDPDVRIKETPSFFDEADEVHISVAFTWDIPWAEWAAENWKRIAPVKVGGPAYNRDMVCKAIEIAEQEMREKAIQAFKSSCMYDIGCAGANRRCDVTECMDLKAFINELNHEENNV